MKNEQVYDLLGIGIGPFNLSVAALASEVPGLSTLFLDSGAEFSWHPELMMPDAMMQTSYLKDLVTGVNPRSRFSFINYLLENQLLYSFLNTSRNTVTRQEFEAYGRWVSRQLINLRFDSEVKETSFKDGVFSIHTTDAVYYAKHICVGTGPTPYVPEVALDYMGESCFHPKIRGLGDLDLSDKRVAIIGGGQTGAEIFYSAISDYWGCPRQVDFYSRRSNFLPLDESPFVNEYFTPDYVRQFSKLPVDVKHPVVSEQKLSSDGITPYLLMDIYRKLYSMRLDRVKAMPGLLPNRELVGMSRVAGAYELIFQNQLDKRLEKLETDIVILATGFRHSLPPFLCGVDESLQKSENVLLTTDFQLPWDNMEFNHIYGVNFGRVSIGISEPQTSLMAWRSGVILNHLVGRTVFDTSIEEKGFVCLSRMESALPL